MNTRTETCSCITAIVLFASLSFSPGAFAEHGIQGAGVMDVTRTIDVSGLDISSVSGAQRAYRQIVLNAKTICRSSLRLYQGVARLNHERGHVRRCFDEAVNGALAQIADATGFDIEEIAALDRFAESGLRASR